MIKKLQPVAIVPQNLSSNEQIRAGFQEVLVDINAIIVQWNETLQPLVDSMPGGRRRLTPADRTANINPVENGCDGSQVFMDMTSTPQVLSGFLYNSRARRPKTIKEVVVDSYASLQSEINKLRVLVDAIDLVDSTYDDTDLRNWIRRLAADTISNLDQGDSFGVGYFGDPTKTVQYSLHQRDVNIRQVIGLEADYGLTSPGFDGTNYIDDMNIIDALVELDSHIGGIEVPPVTLQNAYDNGDGTILCASDTPLEVSIIDERTALEVYGFLTLGHNGVGKSVSIQSHRWSSSREITFFAAADDETIFDDQDQVYSNGLATLNRTTGSVDLFQFQLGPFAAAPGMMKARALILGGRDSEDTGDGLPLWRLGNISSDQCYLEQTDGNILHIGNAIGGSFLYGQMTNFILSDYGTNTSLASDINFFGPTFAIGGRHGGIGGIAESVLSGTDLVTGLMIQGSFLEARGYAPSGQLNEATDPVWPELNRVYRDNIVKAKGSIFNDNHSMTPSSTLLDNSYNISSISHLDQGAVTVYFGTALPETTSFAISVENIGRKVGGATPAFCTEVNPIVSSGKIVGVIVVVQAVTDSGGGVLTLGKPQVDINIFLQAV